MPEDEKAETPGESVEIIKKIVSRRIMDLEACGNNLIVIPDDAEKMSKGGIVIPDASEEAVEFGFVISEGPDCKGSWKGKYIWYGRWLGSKAQLDGQEIRVFDEENGCPLAIASTHKRIQLICSE